MLQEIEITEINELSESDKIFVDLHTVINIINVLFGELQCLSFDYFKDEQLFKPSIDRCEYILDCLRNQKAIAMVEIMAESERIIFENVQSSLAKYPEQATNPDIIESLSNLYSIFDILTMRVLELIDRWQHPERWMELSIEYLKNDFLQFLAAVEKNSKGRYRIIYNLAAHSSKDYFVSFKIDSPTGKTITIPPVFLDVMRDLIANARKYTQVGGKILIGLLDDGQNLCFAIRDTGIGIPNDEITKVVNFGVRGSNVAHLRTMGSGNGLTKAFLVTKLYSGRMWIASSKQLGTRVKIVIPNNSSNMTQ